jgi:hypothetical protein
VSKSPGGNPKVVTECFRTHRFFDGGRGGRVAQDAFAAAALNQ